MASGIIWTPEERTHQPSSLPSINRENSLSVGLLDALLFLPSGTPVNVARPYIKIDKTGTPIPEKSIKGNASYLSGGASWDIASPTNYAAGDFSFHCIVTFRAFGSYATLIDKDNGAGFREIAFFLNTTGNINYIGIGGVNNSDSVALGLSVNSLRDVVITRLGSVVSFYVDGVFKGTATLPYSGTTGSTNPLVLARNSSGGGVNSNVVFTSFSAWNRALRANEVAALYENPWQLFEADNDPVFYSLAGGSNNTATLSSTLEAATLTGIGSVTRSGTLAVTLDAATLSGVGGVSLSGTLSSTLDNTTLTGVGAVTTSGTLSVTLDSATLAGVGSVSVGANRDGALAITLEDATLAGIGAVTRSATLAVTLDNATLVGIGTAGQPRTGTLTVTLDNVTLSGVGAIPAAPSHGGGNGTGRNLSRKQKKKLKAVESQEWLKAEETARQLLNDRFTKQTPQEKAEALQTYVESLQPVIEALKALTTQIEEVKEVVEDAPVMELTPHQEILTRFDTLEKKLKSVEELVIILMADL